MILAELFACALFIESSQKHPQTTFQPYPDLLNQPTPSKRLTTSPLKSYIMVTHCSSISAILYMSLCSLCLGVFVLKISPYSSAFSASVRSLPLGTVVKFFCSLCDFALSFSHLFCVFGGFLPPTRCNDIRNCHAVALTEPTAALVSFQRHSPNQPPYKNVNSADCSRVPASHFGGKYANYATLMTK
jgi:hypothetical protein